MQVQPMKLTLKAPGTKRLELNYDLNYDSSRLLSTFAFKFNLRRYTQGPIDVPSGVGALYADGAVDPAFVARVDRLMDTLSGAKVGRCR
jgi:hypothetical protein